MLNKALVAGLWLCGAATIGRVGVLYASMFTMGRGVVPVAWGADNLRLSLWYTLPVLAILAVHEAGHGLLAWRYRVPVSGPYLLPWPMLLASWVPFLPSLGTLGAAWRFQGTMPSKLAEWDIAFAGLASGAALTVACTVLGSWWSEPMVGRPSMARFWTPRIMRWLSRDHTNWHPLMMAARFGWCFTVTSLIPLRPADGGRLFGNVLEAWASRRGAVCALCLICVLCWV